MYWIVVGSKPRPLVSLIAIISRHQVPRVGPNTHYSPKWPHRLKLPSTILPKTSGRGGFYTADNLDDDSHKSRPTHKTAYQSSQSHNGRLRGAVEVYVPLTHPTGKQSDIHSEHAPSSRWESICAQGQDGRLPRHVGFLARQP